MKKLFALILIIVSFSMLTACGWLSDTPSDDDPVIPPKVEYEIRYKQATLDKDSIGSVWVSAIAEVKNTSTIDLYLSTGSIDLEDSSGKLVEVLSMVSAYPQIISPGETAYYYESTILDNVSVNSTLSVVLHPDIVASKKEKVTFPVTDVVISDREYGGVQAVGRVENNTNEDESWLDIAVVLFDSGKKPLAVLTSTEEVKVGAKKGFTASALRIPNSINVASVSEFKVFGYSYQFQF